MNTETFDAGFVPATYVENLRNYRSFVRGLVKEVSVNQNHVDSAENALNSYAQPVRATMMTEDWCGDAACNLPVLAAFCEAAGIELRVLRGSEHSELEKRYNDEGVDHIPVVSFWDKDFQEIGRWIECPEAVEKKKNQWKAERPEFMELYRRQKADKDAAKEFARLYRTFLDVMADWYRNGMWEETTREVVEILAKN